MRSDLLARGYSREEIDEAFTLESLRDLATHRPDDVLINLNYPQLRTHLHRGRVIDATSAPFAVKRAMSGSPPACWLLAPPSPT